MTRIIADDILQNDASERFDRRPRRRKHHRGFGCCLLLIVGALFGIFIGCAVVAKTGIIQLPFFSDLFYRVPKPTRVVIIDADVNQELATTVDLTSGTATLVITESQFTQVLRSSLSGYDNVAMSTAQAVILPEGIELFGLVLKPVQFNITALVVPSVENKHLTVSVKKLMLGNISLPPAWTTGMIRWLLGDMLDRVAHVMATMAIERIELNDKMAHVVVPISSPFLRTDLLLDSDAVNFFK